MWSEFFCVFWGGQNLSQFAAVKKKTAGKRHKQHTLKLLPFWLSSFFYNLEVQL